jgi:hypothetical protein
MRSSVDARRFTCRLFRYVRECVKECEHAAAREGWESMSKTVGCVMEIRVRVRVRVGVRVRLGLGLGLG